MNPLTIVQKIMLGVMAALLLAVVVLGWQLKDAFKEMGATREALATAKSDNDAWTASEKRHEAFVEEVRQGFKDMTAKIDANRQTNQTFQQQVRSNARSSDALDPDELAALRLFGQQRSDSNDKAGAGQGGAAAKPAPVR